MRLVDAPIRIFVGASDDYDGVETPCEDLSHSLSPSDAAHLSIRVFPEAMREFDVFDGERDFDDPRANRRHGESSMSVLIRSRASKPGKILFSFSEALSNNRSPASGIGPK
ncbi:hypothetical protein OKW49_007938 [Paraburkholderia youngii]|uniref:hypothetical protein n=1 Tax=Paraburkholderia youngii TaxID=2782701 RepID=UPI003D1B3F73